jgi:hypothetical protein
VENRLLPVNAVLSLLTRGNADPALLLQHRFDGSLEIEDPTVRALARMH